MGGACGTPLPREFKDRYRHDYESFDYLHTLLKPRIETKYIKQVSAPFPPLASVRSFTVCIFLSVEFMSSFPVGPPYAQNCRRSSERSATCGHTSLLCRRPSSGPRAHLPYFEERSLQVAVENMTPSRGLPRPLASGSKVVTFLGLFSCLGTMPSQRPRTWLPPWATPTATSTRARIGCRSSAVRCYEL